LKSTAHRDLFLIIVAAFLRAMTVGFIGVVLAVFLFRIGFSSTQIGLVIGAGLAGAAIATSLSAFRADWFGRRRTLVLLAILGALPLFILALHPAFGVVLLVAFIGMLNAMGTDRSAMFAIEQAILPGLVHDTERTWTLSWYNVALDTGTALGSLLGGFPILLGRLTGAGIRAGYGDTLCGLGFLAAATAFIYFLLSPTVETAMNTTARERHRISPATKGVIARLSALFSLDAFGGGLLADALISYWFLQ
jgi:MFS family permease